VEVELEEMDRLLAEALRAAKKAGASGGGGGRALQALLQQARQLHSTALLKDLVLQSQMDLLRRAVVYQAQSVAGLIQQTVQAVKRLAAQGGSSGGSSSSRRVSAAGDASAGAVQGLRGQREAYLEAAAAVAEVLAARDALQQAPGEGSLRALVACLVGAGGRLQQVPELLQGAAGQLAAGGQQEAGGGGEAGSSQEQLIQVVEAVQQVGRASRGELGAGPGTQQPAILSGVSASSDLASHAFDAGLRQLRRQQQQGAAGVCAAGAAAAGAGAAAAAGAQGGAALGGPPAF
jgi:hypothetical protein